MNSSLSLQALRYGHRQPLFAPLTLACRPGEIWAVLGANGRGKSTLLDTLTGVLPPGSRLPSVRELAGQLAINPNTIQRAYRELEADGYILSVAGKGSFVAQVDQLAEQQKKQAVDAFHAAAQKLRQLGLTQAQLAQLLTEEEPTP